jgi:hypothetical protein
MRYTRFIAILDDFEEYGVFIKKNPTKKELY